MRPRIVLAVSLVMLWWILTEGKTSALWFIIPVLAAYAVAERILQFEVQGTRLRIIPLLRFIPSFLYGSIHGGFDVARRVLSPRLPISPGIHRHALSLESDYARAFLAQTISLMPGTLACDIEGNDMLIHALSGTEDQILSDIADLERRIAPIFSETVEVSP